VKVKIVVAMFVVAVALIVLGGNEIAGAATSSPACSITEAHARVHKAARAARKTEARLEEAKRVLTATRAYTAQYGNNVSRWIWLSRQVGWPWGCFPTLMMIIDRESGGNPLAKNPSSTASGLMQFLSSWWLGCWNPFDPRQNLSHGYRAWAQVGWQPWAL
jgi:hypothetical protein